VIVDVEHGAADEAAARGQITAGGPVLVRTPMAALRPGGCSTPAAGVIFPRVASVDDACAVAQSVRCAGSRGVSPFARSNRWGAGGGAWREQADARVASVIQIERATALDQVDAIPALDDVDALYMGPADLSNHLGLPPDLGHPVDVRSLGFSLLSCSLQRQLLRAASNAAARRRSAPVAP
jgi:2-keto-3-deoxy-L-rhamnonate aldolase RhmA